MTNSIAERPNVVPSSDDLATLVTDLKRIQRQVDAVTGRAQSAIETATPATSNQVAIAREYYRTDAHFDAHARRIGADLTRPTVADVRALAAGEPGCFGW